MSAFKRVSMLALLCALLYFVVGTACADAPAPKVRLLTAGEESPFQANAPLLRVEAINVRAADCFLITCGGESMLVDCGNDDAGERVFLALRRQRIGELTYALNTHPHRDHLGGFYAVLPEISAGTFLTAFPEDEDKEQKKLMQFVDGLGIEARRVTSGEIMKLGDAEITFYQWEGKGPTATLNSRSLVTHVRFGDCAILLMADVESPGQRALLEMPPEGAIRADILKISHHGLAPSMRELFTAVAPEFAIITNTRTQGEAAAAQLRGRKLPHLFTTQGDIEMLTDGQIWTIQQSLKN